MKDFTYPPHINLEELVARRNTNGDAVMVSRYTVLNESEGTYFDRETSRIVQPRKQANRHWGDGFSRKKRRSMIYFVTHSNAPAHG